MGDGKGGFLPAVSHPGGYSPRDIGAADFTGDGNADVVVLCHDEIWIFPGSRQADFPSHMTLPVSRSGDGISRLNIMELDLDEKLDLLFIEHSERFVGVFRGRGLGQI